MERLASIGRDGHFVAEVNQRVREELGGNNVVVDYKDVHSWTRQVELEASSTRLGRRRQ